MVQEYLFIEKDYKTKIKENIPENVEIKIFDIENSSCWIAVFSLDGENEKTAHTLSKANDYVIRNYNPTILSNGCSAYYNKSLFPHYNAFERNLRKLLYLKSALCENKKDAELIKDLESKDFGEIFTLLFTDSNYVQNVKKTVNDKTWQFTKDEIISALTQLNEKTLWDNLIGENAVPLLRSNFIKVKLYRNDIMHAHNISSSTYSTAMKLIREINEQLNYEIEKIIDKNIETCSESDFNTTLGNAMKDMEETTQTISWQEILEGWHKLFSSEKASLLFSTLGKMSSVVNDDNLALVKENINLLDLFSIRQSIGDIEKIQLNIPPAIKEIQNLISSTDEYKIKLPEAVFELQESLKEFNPNMNIIGLTSKINNLKEENAE